MYSFLEVCKMYLFEVRINNLREWQGSENSDSFYSVLSFCPLKAVLDQFRILIPVVLGKAS